MVGPEMHVASFGASVAAALGCSRVLGLFGEGMKVSGNSKYISVFCQGAEHPLSLLPTGFMEALGEDIALFFCFLYFKHTLCGKSRW